MFKQIASLFTLKNFLALVCTSLTLLLVYQELYTFSIARPTTISTEEGIIEKEDLPEVVICSEPGLDLKVVDRYGYKRDTYYRGSHDGKKFVGWNGVKNEKPSEEILEEVLTIKDTSLLRSDREVGFYENFISYLTTKVSVRELWYPHGRCISVNPSDITQVGYNDPITLSLELNNSAIDLLVPVDKTDLVLKAYFMDRVNSLGLFPDSMERMNQLTLQFNSKDPKIRTWFNYETSIEIQVGRNHHVQGDPLYACTEYTMENSYHECIHNEILDNFNRELGCAPPFLARSLSTLCNTTFNFTAVKDAKLKQRFRALLSRVVKFKCETPCTQRIFKNTLSHSVPYNGTSLLITFSPKVAITKSKFSIDAETLLTRFGGSVSSGRTLLWILLGLLGAPQVFVDNFFFPRMLDRKNLRERIQPKKIEI